MNLWLTIPSLSKKTGGPANVVQNLSEHLALLGASVSVLTLEAGRGEAEALPRDQRVNVIRVPTDTGRSWGTALTRQFQQSLEQDPSSSRDMVVHDFGLWLPANHAVARVCRKLGIARVCSPCGMLAPWALRHRAWKKKLAWWLYQRRDLSGAALLVATAKKEADDIRGLVPHKPIALVPNGVEVPEVKGRRSRDGGRRTVVFLGRIHPVKGLQNLVEAWRVVRPGGWRCILAGPDEAGHQEQLKALLRLHHLEDAFVFTGFMDAGQKWALLNDADIFVLPSFTENFGIAVAEALAAGVPVITTKGTPWKELVDHRCGWWVDVGVESLANALRTATALADDERWQMGQRGRQLVEEKYSWLRIGREFREVYERVLGRGAPAAVCDVMENSNC